MLPPTVLEKLDSLPAAPGVYLFKDKKGEVVYVGKAKSLRSRVRSYFQTGGSDDRYFIPILQRTVGDLDTIVTATEKEATILENTLIKEHKPRYNVKLRDDKDYIVLRLSTEHPWPRLEVVRARSAEADGARYFGPYHSATAARRTLHLINKHFQLRTCGDLELASRRRPCLQYQIKRCPAPCVYKVDERWYSEQVDAVAKFLDGRHDELSRELVDRMKSAARHMRFELAAVYRDQLQAIEKVRQEQRVVTVDDVDRDVLGLYREGELVELALLYVRSGKLADVGTFSLKQAEIPDEEIVSAFLAQHYGGVRVGTKKEREGKKDEGAGEAEATAEEEKERALVKMPDEIILPCTPEGIVGIKEWLEERGHHKVSLVRPKRGHRVDLLELANENAKHAFAEKRRQSDDVDDRLTQLQERLRLPTVPRRMECCDISHLGGNDTVGAIVAMKDGAPDKKHYRTFHVRGISGGAPGDDYAAMYEVLARRFRRGRAAEEVMAWNANPSSTSTTTSTATSTATATSTSTSTSTPTPTPTPTSTSTTPEHQMTDAQAETARDQIDWELPDLFVVDGGRGQLGIALAAARDLGLHELPIVALAKEKENVAGDVMVDRVYLPGQKNPIALRSHSSSLFFLARLRDEAHRFSNRARERLGKARRFRSELDGIPGIGPATKKALLRNLGTVQAIKDATDDALLAVPGVSARHVKALRKLFPLKSLAAPEGGRGEGGQSN